MAACAPASAAIKMIASAIHSLSHEDRPTHRQNSLLFIGPPSNLLGAGIGPQNVRIALSSPSKRSSEISPRNPFRQRELEVSLRSVSDGGETYITRNILSATRSSEN